MAKITLTPKSEGELSGQAYSNGWYNIHKFPGAVPGARVYVVGGPDSTNSHGYAFFDFSVIPKDAEITSIKIMFNKGIKGESFTSNITANRNVEFRWLYDRTVSTIEYSKGGVYGNSSAAGILSRRDAGTSPTITNFSVPGSFSPPSKLDSNVALLIKMTGSEVTDSSPFIGIGISCDKIRLTIEYNTNKEPVLELSTSDARTLYESDTYAVSGTATDTDSGDVLTVKYKINSGTTRAISTAISTGAAIPFNKSLTFKEGKLFDGATAVTPALAEGTQHVLTVWAEDDKGGKSAEQTRTFYVVPNRPAVLTIDPITPQIDLVDVDKVTVSGNVSDPDGNVVSVKYKIANGSFIEVYNGTGGAFTFDVPLAHLKIGENILSIQATDSYGAITSKTLKITKAQNSQPLKQAVTRYKLTPPNGTAKGVLLWIQREVGDLIVDAEISMTAAGAPESFQPMTKSATAFVSTGIEEDAFTYEHTDAVPNIILKITMERTSTASTQGITLISGVLS